MSNLPSVLPITSGSFPLTAQITSGSFPLTAQMTSGSHPLDIRSLNLSIQPFLNDIVQKSINKDVLLITSPTGSGKSLGIPAEIAKNGYRIFISVPTVISAISLSNTVKTYYPSIPTGYASSNNVQYTDDDLIIYMTSGYLRHLLINKFHRGKSKMWNFTSFIMLDEYHTGSIDNYMIYNIWKYAKYLEQTLNWDLKLPNILLSSATIDIKLGSEVNKYKIPVRTHAVTIEYLNKDYSFHNNQLYVEAGNIASRHHNTDLKGHILIFAPGKSEVSRIIQNLYSVSDADVISAHSGLPQYELEKIYNETGKRKIIVATNIAESSITIENIGLVIDTMCEKIMETTTHGSSRLSLKNISKSSANQRKGRTGRTGPGLCIRMITEKTYQTLPSHRVEEINRVPIYNILMEIINVGIPPDILLNKISNTNKVPIQQILESIKIMQYMNNIDSNYNITETGKFVTKLQLSVRNSTSLWYWVNSDTYEDNYAGIVIMSLIDSHGPPYTWIPRYNNTEYKNINEYRDKINKHVARYYSEFISNSDIEAYVKIWNKLMRDTNLESPTLKEHISTFSRENGLNNKKINEVVKVIRQITRQLPNLEYNVVENNQINYSDIVGKLRKILKVTYSNTIFNINKKSHKLGYVHDDHIYSLDNKNYLNTLRFTRPNKIIALSRIEHTTRRNTVNRIISLALDLSDDDIDTKIVLNPSSKYQVHTPITSKSTFKSKFAEQSVYISVVSLPALNLDEILTSPVSLKDPNHTKYIMTDSIIVK